MRLQRAHDRRGPAIIESPRVPDWPTHPQCRGWLKTNTPAAMLGPRASCRMNSVPNLLVPQRDKGAGLLLTI
jgi:hypothetical protein